MKLKIGLLVMLWILLSVPSRAQNYTPGAGEAANQCRCLPHEDDDLRFCADKECRHA